MQHKVKLILVYSLLAVLWPGLVSALGLGQISVQSSLNEPLRAEIALLSVTEEEFNTLKISLADNILFQTNRMPVSAELKSLQFQPKRSDGKNYIAISSSRPFTKTRNAFFIKVQSSSGVVVLKYKITLAAKAKPLTLGRERTELPQDRASLVTVAAGETLWSIASRYTAGSKVSGSQMMLAIQAINADAFNGRNINGLKKGSTLRIPQLAKARSIKPAEAFTEVRQQGQQWQQRRAAQSPPAGRRLTTVASDDKRKLVILAQTPSGRGAVESQSVAVQQENRLLQEQLESKTQENLELLARIDNLELVLNKQEAIIEVQNKQLARLQEILDRFENLAPLKPQVSAPAAEEELRTEIKTGFEAVWQFSQNTWLSFKLWLDKQSIAFLLGVSALCLWILVILTMLLLQRHKSVSEKAAALASTEPSVDPQPVTLQDKKVAEVSAASAQDQQASTDSIDNEALKTLVDDEVLKTFVNEEELPEDVATKLDLAPILLEMGDIAAAKENLHQVIAEGDDEQVQAAQQLLAKIIINHKRLTQTPSGTD